MRNDRIPASTLVRHSQTIIIHLASCAANRRHQQIDLALLRDEPERKLSVLGIDMSTPESLLFRMPPPRNLQRKTSCRILFSTKRTMT